MVMRMLDTRRVPRLIAMIPGNPGIFVSMDDLLAYLEESKPGLDSVIDEMGMPLPSQVVESVILNLRALALDGAAIIGEHSE